MAAPRLVGLLVGAGRAPRAKPPNGRALRAKHALPSNYEFMRIDGRAESPIPKRTSPRTRTVALPHSVRAFARLTRPPRARHLSRMNASMETTREQELLGRFRAGQRTALARAI